MAKTKAASVETPAPDAAPANPEGDAHDFRVADAPISLEAVEPSITEPEIIEPSFTEPERKLSRRDQQMADIVAARQRRIEQEQEYARQAGLGAEPEPEPAAAGQDAPEPPVAIPAAPQASPQPAPAAAPASPAPSAEPPRTVKITVRGRELDITEAEARRAAEIGVEAEARFRQAEQLYQEALRLRAPTDSSAGHSSPPAATPATPQAPPPGLAEDEALEIARAIQYGDEKEVADAVRRITAQRQAAQPAIDPAAIAREVHERVGTQLRLEQDLHTFSTEYSDIVQDAPLTVIAAQYVQQLRNHYIQTQTPVAELDLFRQAGQLVREDVRRWAGGAAQPDPQPATPAPQPAPAASSGDSARTIIKRNTPSAPAAAGAIASPSAPRPKTGTDIVNDFRRARGQPVYV